VILSLIVLCSLIADRPLSLESRLDLKGSAKTVLPSLIVLGELDFVPRTGLALFLGELGLWLLELAGLVC